MHSQAAEVGVEVEDDVSTKRDSFFASEAHKIDK